MLENIQAIISVITNAPDAELRKTAFAALKRVKFFSLLHFISLLQGDDFLLIIKLSCITISS